MATGTIELPEGFVLDQQKQPAGLPEGFVLDAKQPDSMATQGLGYLGQHPFKAAFESPVKTATGKTLVDRGVETVGASPYQKNFDTYGNGIVGKVMNVGTIGAQTIASAGADFAEGFTSPASLATYGVGGLIGQFPKAAKGLQQAGQVIANTGVGKFVWKGLNTPISQIGKGIAEGVDKFAGRINNSLIRAHQKDLIYGNPGMGIAKEKISSGSIEGLGKKVNERLSSLGQNLDNIYNQNVTKVSDYDHVLKPLTDTLAKLNKNPLTNSTPIQRLNNAILDITGQSKNAPRNFKRLSPLEARKLKQDISEFADWSLTGKGDKEINIAFKKSYHMVDSILDSVVPQAKTLNDRVTNLISAKKLIESEVRRLQTKDPLPFTLGSMVDLPFKALRSPIVQSNLASTLAKKYVAPGIVAGGVLAGSMFNPLNAQAAEQKTIGMKNNNPINLKAFDKWDGMTGKDKQGHAQFKDLDSGIRAAIKNLQNHKTKNPSQSLEKYLNSFAEKNGKQEAEHIAKALGVTTKTSLAVIDMEKLIIPMAEFESKIKLTPADIARVKKKYNLK